MREGDFCYIIVGALYTGDAKGTAGMLREVAGSKLI